MRRRSGCCWGWRWPASPALAVIARPLLFASLQPELAEARGVPLRLVSVLFLAIVAVATAESAQIVGVLLVFALMVGPAAAAQRLTSRLGRGSHWRRLLAVAEAWAGLTLAFYTDWPTSFWITALSGGDVPSVRPPAHVSSEAGSTIIDEGRQRAHP